MTAQSMASEDGIQRATVVARLETGEQAAHRTAALVTESYAADDVAVSLVESGAGRWRVVIHFRAAPDEDAVRALVAAAAGAEAAETLIVEQIAAKDWVRESLAGLEPVAAGRFIVHGAHDRAAVPVNRIGIEIEAALAFGTGHHGTTRGCLLALDRLCRPLSKRRVIVRRHPEVRAKSAFDALWRASKDERPRRPPFEGRAVRGRLRVTEAMRILDVGTGSGVLAIAAARALRQRVLATDIDGSAVRIARANAELNRARTMIAIRHANGVAARGVRERAPFDLIFANILLAPLQRMAVPLQRLIAPGGRVVLSGLLRAQASAALAAYRGLALERRIELDGWTTLVLVRRVHSRRAVARRHRRP